VVAAVAAVVAVVAAVAAVVAVAVDLGCALHCEWRHLAGGALGRVLVLVLGHCEQPGELRACRELAGGVV